MKRVVLTSSFAAISSELTRRIVYYRMGRHFRGGLAGNEGKPRDYVYTPDDWTDPESPRCRPYEASKTYAEKAIREFVEKLEGEFGEI